MTEGIYEYIDSATYHADFEGDPRASETPSLSASVAHLLLSKSPAHARFAHPRLNPEWAPKEDRKFDIGKAAHAFFLEGNADIEVIPFPNYNKNAAKEARDNALLHCKKPILEDDYARVVEMAAAITEQLAQMDIEPIPFTVGRPEVTLCWEDDGVACRARVDWLHEGNAFISDLKTTRASANPEAWCRSTLWSIGADIQVAAYTSGVEKLTGVRPEFRYCVVEVEPPYALSIISLTPQALAIGQAKWEYALGRWRECLAVDAWPSYPSQVCYAEVPAWEEQRWLEREAREEMVA